MGARAFCYYFPVIDKYLRNAHYEDEWDDCEADILGSGIAAQFDWNDNPLKDEAVKQIAELHHFVTNNITRYSASPKGQRRILRAWSEVQAKVEAYGK